MRSIDLNCDMGEGFGAWPAPRDEELMPYITSANLACGAHAGDPDLMLKTVRMARERGVAVGAHPSYPDLQGFGRRAMRLAPGEARNWILYQIGALAGVARAVRVDLSHVKPHGALYNAAARDAALAREIAEAVWLFSPSLVLYCLPRSELERAGRDKGLVVAREGFVDRAYEPDGLLADRKLPGAVYASPERAVAQALELAGGRVTCRDGTELETDVDTLCVHSDTPAAVEIARLVSGALSEAGYRLAPIVTADE